MAALSVFGMVTTGFNIGGIIGPLLGGWITDNISWPWIFYINVPIGLFAGLGDDPLHHVPCGYFGGFRAQRLHASREIEIINALLAADPETRVVVRTSAARWLFDVTVRGPVEFHELVCDTGVVQRDSLTTLMVTHSMAQAANLGEGGQVREAAVDVDLALARRGDDPAHDEVLARGRLDPLVRQDGERGG